MEAHLSTHRHRQLNLREVGLDCANVTPSGRRPDVYHENLPLGQLLDLSSLLVALRLDAQQPPQQEVVDLKIGIDLGQLTRLPENLTHKPARARFSASSRSPPAKE